MTQNSARLGSISKRILEENSIINNHLDILERRTFHHLRLFSNHPSKEQPCLSLVLKTSKAALTLLGAYQPGRVCITYRHKHQPGLFSSQKEHRRKTSTAATHPCMFSAPISFGIGGSTAFMLVLCCGLACLPRRGHEKPHHTF